MAQVRTLTTPYKDLLQPLSSEEFVALRADIEAHGVLHPIIVDEEGQILDGHHRYKITKGNCEVKEVLGLTDAEKKAFVISTNNKRRNLSPEQKAELRCQMMVTARELREEDPGRWTQEEIAKCLGVGRQTVSDWENIRNAGSGKANIDARVTVPKESRLEVFERFEAGQKQSQIAADFGISQSRVAQIVNRERNRIEAQEKVCEPQDVEGVVSDLSQLNGGFGTIYADPPWRYGNQGTRAATDNHYPTMSVDELCEMPIRKLAAADAHLHLWTTNAFLFDAKRVMDAWGFEYRSVYVWVKPQMGIGNYWRVSHEFMLLGIRGDAKRFNEKKHMSWGEFPRKKHSAKPGEVRSLIEKVSPGPFLELFGRHPVERWTVFGNQISDELF